MPINAKRHDRLVDQLDSDGVLGKSSRGLTRSGLFRRMAHRTNRRMIAGGLEGRGSSRRLTRWTIRGPPGLLQSFAGWCDGPFAETILISSNLETIFQALRPNQADPPICRAVWHLLA